MNRILFFLLVGITSWVRCTSDVKDGYKINAQIIGIEDFTPIYFQKVVDGNLVSVDTAKIIDSQVVFEGVLDQPEMIYLRVGDSRKMVNVYAENSEISIRVQIDSLPDAVVNGSSIHDDLMTFKEYMQIIDDRSADLNEAYRIAASTGDDQRKEKILQEYEGLRAEQTEMIRKFVADRPHSYISPFIIRSYLAFEMEYKELEEVLSALDQSVHDSQDFGMLRERADILKTVAVGMPAVDFALNDTIGNPISISSFRGKILLIDFWASWCTPCRVENPKVVQLYNDYKDRDFEIIGVSFDERRDNWIRAINNDNLTWPQVSDLRGWSSSAGKLYAINSIPATVLIDKEGKIIAKNLRGDALREKLEELYAKEAHNS